MKCRTRVLWRDARRKGNGEPYRKAVGHYYPGFPIDSIQHGTVGRLEVCEGRIVATVAAHDEPEWGGSRAVLEIAYKCDVCGATTFPDLPDSPEKLSEFVTRAIALIGLEGD